MHTDIYRMDKQGLTVWHREPYSVSTNHSGEEYEKEYIYILTPSWFLPPLLSWIYFRKVPRGLPTDESESYLLIYFTEK